MMALIACVQHVQCDDMPDEEIAKRWAQTKYFMELAYGVKWNG